MTAIGFVLGLVLSGASALLLPLIFPEPKKTELSRDLDDATRAAQNLQRTLEHAKQAAESEQQQVTSTR